MSVTTNLRDDGVVVVTVDYPPVNAIPVQGWHDLAAALRVGSDARAVVLRAVGRGFCAGIDIKEVQRDGHAALVGVNAGCAAAFAAVYDCPVPVVAAVHGFCLGGGVGLVGNADVVVASEDARFALPEVDRGALGAATHLARLVPQHLMRTLYYTAGSVTAAELHHHGSVFRVVPRPSLDAAALEVAGAIAAKDPRVIRAAKQALNGIDPQHVHRSYRYEQGFTFELNLLGAGDEARAAFLSGDSHAG
ncbi:MAG: enoyl-CoA hydratase family protein [Micromonosporaceae bacterium]